MMFAAMIIGVLMRFIDVTAPDLVTDEAQFALGSSAAHPPLGLWIMQFSQMILGHTLLGARFPSIVAGLLTLVLLYILAKQLLPKYGAQLAVALAAVLPSAILFSRLAYLSALQCLAWTALTLVFLMVRKNMTGKLLILLYALAVAATFIKAQGLLLPGLFLLGRMIEKRKSFWKDPIARVLLCSFAPIFAYILTHPGIVATVTQNSGGNFGTHGSFGRFIILFQTWWNMLSITILIPLLGFLALRSFSGGGFGSFRFPWPFLCLCLLSLVQGLLLGPGHEYYTYDLVTLCIPAAAILFTLPHRIHLTVLGVEAAVALALLWPSFFGSNPFRIPMLQSRYFNTHADTINAKLGNAKQVVVVGDAGHDIRWYINAQVLVGKDMDLKTWTGALVILHPATTPQGRHPALYNDERLTILGPLPRPR